MKYLVTGAWEVDGHASASAIVLASREMCKKYIDACLEDEEGKPMGKITSSRLLDDGYEYYGEWDCGQFSFRIRKFKNYSDMIGKEIGAITG